MNSMRNWIIQKLEPMKFIFMPSFWVMNESYSEVLDHAIIEAINQNKVVFLGYYYSSIGELKIWTANYPYAFGTAYNRRPSRLTIQRLHAHIRKLGWEESSDTMEMLIRELSKKSSRSDS
jgi:hypothetical protein